MEGKLEEQLVNSGLLRGVARAQPITQDEPHIPFVSCLECDPAISTAFLGWDSSFLGSASLSSLRCLYYIFLLGA